jgi:hypothetical protein
MKGPFIGAAQDPFYGIYNQFYKARYLSEEGVGSVE